MDPSTDLATSSDAAAGGRHPVHITHLVMGLAFLGLVAVWAFLETGLVGDGDVRWLLPWPWIVAGAAGLVATVAANRRRTRTTDPYGRRPGGTDPYEEDLR